MSTAAYLQITSFIGISSGIHYYGKIYFNNKFYELKKRVSQEIANRLNERDKYATYEKGDRTSRFDTENEVIRFAKRFFKNKLSALGAKYLILGRSSYAEPQPIIIGTGKEVNRINRFSKEADKIGRWDNEKEMEKIWEEWRIISNKLRITNYHPFK